MSFRRGVLITMMAVLRFSAFALVVPLEPSRAYPSHSTTTVMKMSVKSQECNIQEDQVELSSGVSMKVQWCDVATATQAKKQGPPLVFLHGSFHGGWCWTEHFFDFFSSLGYGPVFAVNWRGTGGTFAGEGVKKVKMEEHVQDLKAFLEEFVTPKLEQRQTQTQKPILISHSFGGLSIMKYLEEYPDKLSTIGGAVIMCSVPPSGNGKMTMRFLRRSLRASWKITKGLAMKKVIGDPVLCRELFFGGSSSSNDDDDNGVSEEDIHRYMGYFERDSEATIDLMDLAKKLPSAQIDENGKALFFSSPNAPAASQQPPFLVVGATEDFIVDKEGAEETAKYFGLKRAVMVDSPHDVMLGDKYKNAAQAIHQWVQQEVAAL